MAGLGNQIGCADGNCNQIYPDWHTVRQILGSKAQFCGAFYHVHSSNTREHECLDENLCEIAGRTWDEHNSLRNWERQPRTIVAVVKFQDSNGDVRYEARYSNCRKTKQHAEDFFDHDVRSGDLNQILQEHQSGKITMYLTYQPCNNSTEGTMGSWPNHSCCNTLTTLRNDVLASEPNNIHLRIKVTHLYRQADINAIDGIQLLLRNAGIEISSMEENDWQYLITIVNGLTLADLDYNQSPRSQLDNEIHNYLISLAEANNQ